MFMSRSLLCFDLGQPGERSREMCCKCREVVCLSRENGVAALLQLCSGVVYPLRSCRSIRYQGCLCLHHVCVRTLPWACPWDLPSLRWPCLSRLKPCFGASAQKGFSGGRHILELWLTGYRMLSTWFSVFPSPGANTAKFVWLWESSGTNAQRRTPFSAFLGASVPVRFWLL